MKIMWFKILFILCFSLGFCPTKVNSVDVNSSVEYVIEFKEMSTDFVNDSEHDKVLQLGKLFQELRDTTTIILVVRSVQNQNEFAKNNLIGFLRFRAFVNFLRDRYNLDEEMFYFIDGRDEDTSYNRPGTSKKTGLSIYLSNLPCGTKLNIKFIKSKKNKRFRIAVPLE